ncbi:MAG: single-stranded-DNA-specific exonuclease RecJ [Lachnospiraceae bacterium]
MQKEKWILINKGADFAGISEKFSIDPVIARLIRNKDIVDEKEINTFLNGDLDMLYSPHLLKDADKAAGIIKESIKKGERIHIIGDYDIDGIQSSYILYRGIEKAGGQVSVAIPDRIMDGYGINENLILQAYEQKIDVIVTCDNGIAAIEAIEYAKKLGMKVIITDHHEIPFVEEHGIKRELKNTADAVINPKQEKCSYPFKKICGATVAWKLIQALYDLMEIDGAMEYIENAAFATIGDVMDLVDENRIIVKFGLRKMRETKNFGLQSLIERKQIDRNALSVYHIGFVLGPCLNASGRISTAQRSLKLLLSENKTEADQIALELDLLNEERKEMTALGVKEAEDQIRSNELFTDDIMIIYLPTLHESLAGIIAGRIRERYHHPVFVLTNAEHGIKGSGRSIEEYSMFEKMSEARHLMEKFGGHPMAAGLSLLHENLPNLKKYLNENSGLVPEDFVPKIKIDLHLPLSYVSKELIQQFSYLEPFGKGNTKPVFADRNIRIRSKRIIGKNKNVLRISIADNNGYSYQAIYFGEVEQMNAYLEDNTEVSILYYPELNVYQGIESIQFILLGCQ